MKKKVWWQKDRQKMQLKLQVYEDFVNELRDYLSSTKFKWPEDNVNVNDIFRRLSLLQHLLGDIEMENHGGINYED